MAITDPEGQHIANISYPQHQVKEINR